MSEQVEIFLSRMLNMIVFDVFSLEFFYFLFEQISKFSQL